MSDEQYGPGTRRVTTGDLGVEVHPHRPEWWDHAACRGMGVELFFDKDRADEARQVCAACPARIPCAAVGKQQSDGMWNGRFKSDYWRKRKPNRVPPPLVHGTVGGYNRHRREGTAPCDECRKANAFVKQLGAERRRNRGAA